MLTSLLLSALATLDDPLTGVWEGRGKGDNPMIPPEGFAFTLVLEARGEDEALASLSMEGASAKPAEASFDAESGELEFRCDLMGILVDVELVLSGDELAGKASGLGMTVELTGKRTSRELPAQETASRAPAPVDLTTLSSAAWREDLAFLAETLPRKHANAFHTLAREDWESRVRALGARLPELSPAGAAVALAQLVAAVGDAHTELALVGKPFDVFLPVRFVWFADGVGKCSADDALRAVCTTFASENDSWPRAKAPSKLSQPVLLAALGVVPSSNSIPIVVAGASGEDVAVTIDGSGSGKWLVAPDPSLGEPPLWLRRTNEGYWFEALGPERAVYVAYNRCAEDPARPMVGFVAEVLAALESSDAERLVIDLRHNSGGNSAVLARFVPDLAAHPRLAAPGSVRVLIGPQTFSSGMRNAQDLREGARARLIGEPTGGKPNAYGEVRVFALPRSGLSVYHSTKSFHDLAADSSAVEPDALVPLSSADYFAGVDAALKRAIAD